MDAQEATALLPGRAPRANNRPRTLLFVLLLALPATLVLIDHSRVERSQTGPYHTREVAGHNKDCDAEDFRETTLKLLYEVPLAFLLSRGSWANQLHFKYEASAIALDPAHGQAFVAFDNLHDLAQLDDPFRNASKFPYAKMVKWPIQHEGDSGFEFLTFNASDGSYIVGREAVKGHHGRYAGVTHDVQFENGVARVGQTCTTEFLFQKENKGFEGGAVVADGKGGSLLLGLCEGNFCRGGKKGRANGHGRVVVMRRTVGWDGCKWETVEVLHLPKAADFQDYSDLAVAGGRYAVLSQENAAVFVGAFGVEDGRVLFGEGQVVDLPRGDGCEVVYCNVEGVAFLGKQRLMVVSDEMKGKGDQSFRCRQKDQSVHVFQLPKL